MCLFSTPFHSRSLLLTTAIICKTATTEFEYFIVCHEVCAQNRNQMNYYYYYFMCKKAKKKTKLFSLVSNLEKPMRGQRGARESE